VVYASKIISVPEGDDNSNKSYVVTIPIVKIKRQEYLAVLKSGRKDEPAIGSVQDFKDLQFKVLSGVIDDFELAPVQQTHVAEFKTWLQQQELWLAELLGRLQSYSNKKELAAQIAGVWFKKILFDQFSATNNSTVSRQPPTIRECLLTTRSDQTTILQQYQNGGDMWFHKLTANR